MELDGLSGDSELMVYLLCPDDFTLRQAVSPCMMTYTGRSMRLENLLVVELGATMVESAERKRRANGLGVSVDLSPIQDIRRAMVLEIYLLQKSPEKDVDLTR